MTTLLSDGDMMFAKKLQRRGKDQKVPFFEGARGGQALSLKLPRRSTLVLEGKAANEVEHAINAVTDRRMSILLRNAK